MYGRRGACLQPVSALPPTWQYGPGCSDGQCFRAVISGQRLGTVRHTVVFSDFRLPELSPAWPWFWGDGSQTCAHPAAALYQQGKFAEAAVLYQNAARTAAAPPAQASAFYNLGNAYLRAGQYAQAIEAYEHSLRRQPNQPDAKKNLQIAKLKLREQQEPPPPPIPPPPPPPPPKQRPRNNYLDQASIGQKREVPAGGLTPETARSLLETRVTRQEQQNAQAYRQLAAPNRPSRVKKDW